MVACGGGGGDSGGGSSRADPLGPTEFEAGISQRRITLNDQGELEFISTYNGTVYTEMIDVAVSVPQLDDAFSAFKNADSTVFGMISEDDSGMLRILTSIGGNSIVDERGRTVLQFVNNAKVERLVQAKIPDTDAPVTYTGDYAAQYVVRVQNEADAFGHMLGTINLTASFASGTFLGKIEDRRNSGGERASDVNFTQGAIDGAGKLTADALGGSFSGANPSDRTGSLQGFLAGDNAAGFNIMLSYDGANDARIFENGAAFTTIVPNP